MNIKHLPIEPLLPRILNLLESGCLLVLAAPPGTGKTTRVPLALRNAPWLQGRKLLMLEPRRLAAKAAASYMAHLLGERPGQTVGYRTRLDSCIGPTTRVEVVTEGILTRLLQDDPELSAYGLVIFDEFHERSLQADLGLALAYDCQQGLRPDLRLLVMSATLDSERVSRLLGDAPCLQCTAPLFPVDIQYVPARSADWLEVLIAELWRLLRDETGSLLVFLPGEAEIRRVIRHLEDRVPAEALVLPLYGQLSSEQQALAIQPASPGLRKIVLATSIAESSLTIEGVRLVIDSGWVRQPIFDAGSGMQRLETLRLSSASADQRAGRAGRSGPGICVRLWSEDEHARLMPFTSPEILHSDLSAMVLELAQWGVREPSQLSFLDEPPSAHWTQALSLLGRMGLLDVDWRITDRGRAALVTGLAPRLGHMVAQARGMGLGRLAADTAALLMERDVGGHDSGVDLANRLALLWGEIEPSASQRGPLKRVREAARRLHRTETEIADSVHHLGRVLALAYPDRIARRRPGKAPRYLLANGRGVYLEDHDPLGAASWLVVADLDGKARESRVYLAAALTEADLSSLPKEAFETQEAVFWDETSQMIRVVERVRLGAIIVSEKTLDIADPQAVLDLWCMTLRDQQLRTLPWTDELRQLQARVAVARKLEPDLWPAMDDASLMETLPEWAGWYLQGITRLSDLADFPLRAALEGLLEGGQLRKLNTLLPLEWMAPTGFASCIDYLQENGPVLSIKLQEMFGITETPRIAGGRIPLTLHLLSPARRPVAVTRDLASFWQQGYADVRRDLRGRYPKHPWPEDPLTAPAQRFTKKTENRS